MTQYMQDDEEGQMRGVTSTASLHAIAAELTQTVKTMQQQMRALDELRTQSGGAQVLEGNPFVAELQTSLWQHQSSVVAQLQRALSELDKTRDEMEGKGAALGNIYDRQKALRAAKRSMQRYFEGHCKLQEEQRRTYEALVSVQQAQLGSVAATAAEVHRTQCQRRLLRMVWTRWLKRAMIYAFSRHCVALQQAGLARWYALAQHVTSPRYAARERARRALSYWARRTERRVRGRLHEVVEARARQLREAQERDAAGQQLLRSQLAATQSSAAHTHRTQSRECVLLEDEATRLRRQMHEMTREFHERTATYVEQQEASERYVQTREAEMQQAVLCMQAELEQRQEKDRQLVGHVAALQDRLQDYHVQLEAALWQGMTHKAQLLAAVAAEQLQCVRRRCDAMRAETAELRRDIAVLAPLSEEVLRWEGRAADAEARLQHVNAERQQLLAQLAQAERVYDVFTGRVERCTQHTLRCRYFVRWAQRALGAKLQASRQQCQSLSSALQVQERAAVAERQERQAAQQAALAQLQSEIDVAQGQCSVLEQEKQYAVHAWQECDQQHCQTQAELAELQARWAQHARQQQSALETIHHQQRALVLLHETTQRGMLASSEQSWFDALRDRELHAWQVYACGAARQLLELRQETEMWRAQGELQAAQQRVRRQRSLAACAACSARQVQHTELLRWWLRWQLYAKERRVMVAQQDVAAARSAEAATQRCIATLQVAAQQHRDTLARSEAVYEAASSRLRDEHASVLRTLAVRHEAALREAVTRVRGEAQQALRRQRDEADRTTDKLGRLLVEYCARGFFVRWRAWCVTRRFHALQRQMPLFVSQCRWWYGSQASLVLRYYAVAQDYYETTTIAAAALLPLQRSSRVELHAPPSRIDAATMALARCPTRDASTSPLQTSPHAAATTAGGNVWDDKEGEDARRAALSTAARRAAAGVTGARQMVNATLEATAEPDAAAASSDLATDVSPRDFTGNNTAMYPTTTPRDVNEAASALARPTALPFWPAAIAATYLDELFDLIETHTQAGEQLYELAARNVCATAAAARTEDVVVSPTTPLLLRATRDDVAHDDNPRPPPTATVTAAAHEASDAEGADREKQRDRGAVVAKSPQEAGPPPSASSAAAATMKGRDDVLPGATTAVTLPTMATLAAHSPERPRAADEAGTQSPHGVYAAIVSAAVTTATTSSYTAEAPQQGLTNSPSPCEVSALTSERGSSSGSVAHGQSPAGQTPHTPAAAAALVIDVAAQTPPRSNDAATAVLHAQLRQTQTALAEARRSLCLVLVEQEQLARRMHRAATRRWSRRDGEANTGGSAARRRRQRGGGEGASPQVPATGQYAAMLERQQQQRQRSARNVPHTLEQSLDFWCEQLRLLSARWQAVVTESATATTSTMSEEDEAHDRNTDEACSTDYLLRVMDGHTRALQCRLTANAAELQELRRRWHSERTGSAGTAPVAETALARQCPDKASQTPRTPHDAAQGGTLATAPVSSQVLSTLRGRLQRSWAAYATAVEACMHAVRTLTPPAMAAQAAMDEGETARREERRAAEGETAATSPLAPPGGRSEQRADAAAPASHPAISDDAETDEVGDFVDDLLAHFAPHTSSAIPPPVSPAVSDVAAVDQTPPGRDLCADLHAARDDAAEAAVTAGAAAPSVAAMPGAAEESPTKRRLRDQVRLLERMLVESKLQLAEVKAMLDDSRQRASRGGTPAAASVGDSSAARASCAAAVRDNVGSASDAEASATRYDERDLSAIHEQEMTALMQTLRQVRALDMDERRRLAAQLQEQMHRAVDLVRDHAAQEVHATELKLQTLRATMQERLDRAASSEAALRVELQQQISTRNMQEQEAERVLQSVKESFQREIHGLVDAYDTARAELTAATERHKTELEAQGKALASERQRLQRDVASMEKRMHQTEAELSTLRAQRASVAQHELAELTRQHHEETQQLQARCSALRQKLQQLCDGPSPTTASLTLLCTRVLQHEGGLAAMAQVVLGKKADYILHYCGRHWAAMAAAQQTAVAELQRNAANEREALETELVRLHERMALLTQGSPTASRPLDAVDVQDDRIRSERGGAEDAAAAHEDGEGQHTHGPATRSATQTPSSRAASSAAATTAPRASSAALMHIADEPQVAHSATPHRAASSSGISSTREAALLSSPASPPSPQRRASSATQTPVRVRSPSRDTLELSQQVLRYSAQLSLQRERNAARRSSADALTARLDHLLHEGTRLQQLIEAQPM